MKNAGTCEFVFRIGEVGGRHKRWSLQCGSQDGSRGSKAQLERRWWQGLVPLERQEAGTESGPLPQPRFLPEWEVTITHLAIITPPPPQGPSLPTVSVHLASHGAHL